MSMSSLAKLICCLCQDSFMFLFLSGYFFTLVYISCISFLQRDDIRRFQHNQIERARREKINNWIMVLGRIIDDNSEDDNTNCDSNHTSNKNGEVLSKGGILEKVNRNLARMHNKWRIYCLFFHIRRPVSISDS